MLTALEQGGQGGLSPRAGFVVASAGRAYNPGVSLRVRTRVGLAATVCAIVVSGAARAQQEQYGEREELDPATDAWRVAAPVAGDAAGTALDQARSYLARGESRRAFRILRKWVEENPDHERYYESRYLLGESYFERKYFYQAYEQYEEVIDNTAGELFFKALRRELDVARAFLSGEKRIVWRFLRMPAYDDGIQILDRIWERAPGTRLGEDALRLKADYFFATGDNDLAQDEYANLASEYPNGRFSRLAMLRAAEAADAAFPGIRFDDRPLVEAEERYRQVKSAFPQFAERELVDERLTAIRQKRAAKDLSIAKWYERTGRRGAAEFYFRQIIRQWPGTIEDADARTRLRALGIELEPTDGQERSP